MKNILKTAVITGFVSAGVFVGGTTSYAADFNSQSSFSSQGKLTLLGNSSSILDLGLDLSNQTNLTLGEKNAISSNEGNQPNANIGVKDGTSARTKENLKVNTRNVAEPRTTVNSKLTSQGNISGNTESKANGNLVLPSGYYINVDGEIGRVEGGTSNNTKTHLTQAVVFNQKSAAKSSIVVNEANQSNSDLLNTNLSSNSEWSITSKTSNDMSTGGAPSSFDLLVTLTQAFNLDIK